MLDGKPQIVQVFRLCVAELNCSFNSNFCVAYSKHSINIVSILDQNVCLTSNRFKQLCISRNQLCSQHFISIRESWYAIGETKNVRAFANMNTSLK